MVAKTDRDQIDQMLLIISGLGQSIKRRSPILIRYVISSGKS